MSRALITESYLTDIANAIRAKLEVQDTYTPPQMAAAIEGIPTGGITPTGTKNITQNGTHDVTQYASANVNVQPNLQSKTVTQNGTVTPDQGYDGLSSVIVNVQGGGVSVYAFVKCSYTAGNTITATDGVTTLTGDTSGEYVFSLPNAGTWTFSDGLLTDTIIITTFGTSTAIDLRKIILVQDYTMDADADFTYSNRNTLQVTWDPSAQNITGFIVDTKGKSCTVSRTSGNGNVQTGRCTKSATMPGIVQSGSGRVDYGSVPRTVTDTSDYNVFVGIYGASGMQTFVITLTD